MGAEFSPVLNHVYFRPYWHRCMSLTKYSSNPWGQSQQKHVAMILWKCVRVWRSELMKWGTICNAAPRTKHAHTEPQSHCLCALPWLPVASYSSCPRQLSPATTGPPFHPIYNWITKAPSLLTLLLASHVLGQTWALFISQNSISFLNSSLSKSFFIWRPFSFFVVPSLIMWLLRSSQCVSVDLNKTSQNFCESMKLSPHSNFRRTRMLAVFYSLIKIWESFLI